jgi:hypothetical protein
MRAEAQASACIRIFERALLAMGPSRCSPEIID